MDFHKSLFWICFIIITFTVYNLNPTFKSQELTYDNFGPVIWKNIPIEIKVFKMLTHLKQKSQTGNRQTVAVDYVKLM